jgi:hypothetical protein
LALNSQAFAAPLSLQADAHDAWLYALPLIEMSAARMRMIDLQRPGQHAGLNVFSHDDVLVGPEDRGITTPNNDTLYSNAFIDLTRGPVTLKVPDAGSRYLSVAVMDMFTNNNVVLSARTPGGAAGTYRLLGPDMTPGGPGDLRVATPHAWVLSRVLVNGPTDLSAARAMQRKVILSGPKGPPPRAFAERSDSWSAFFQSAEMLIKSEGTGARGGYDAFRRLQNACHSQDFARSGYSPNDAALIDAGVDAARTLVESASSRVRFTDGWNYPKNDLGNYGDDFIYRAIISVAGLGALTPKEAMYMRAAAEDGTAVFHDDKLYRFSLPKPMPVDGFWSLTMYEAMPNGQFFLTRNPIKRYAIGDRTPGLKRNPNGGVDIWIGRSDPLAARTSNWLPAPKSGPFSLTLRAYLPKAEMMNGNYRAPPIISL